MYVGMYADASPVNVLKELLSKKRAYNQRVHVKLHRETSSVFSVKDILG